MNIVNLLPFEVANGPHNMAADEVLLGAAATGTASLRFYAWSVPTLSLGYFQPQAVRHTDPLLVELPYVRRATGGATLVHHHELTYALALPAGLPWQSKGQSWLCHMHGAIAAALETFGVTARAVPCGEEKKLDDVLCFLHQTAGDLTVAGHKVVGSAQRKQRGALLQHGAILLAQSPHAPRLPGLNELTGTRPTVGDLCRAVQRAFATTTGWELRERGWTGAERTRTVEMADQKYGSASWNGKR